MPESFVKAFFGISTQDKKQVDFSDFSAYFYKEMQSFESATPTRCEIKREKDGMYGKL
jgi:hypothetical protein